jgi:hypothetical protein
MAEVTAAPLNPWWDESEHADVYTEEDRHNDAEEEKARAAEQARRDAFDRAISTIVGQIEAYHNTVMGTTPGEGYTAADIQGLVDAVVQDIDASEALWDNRPTEYATDADIAT